MSPSTLSAGTLALRSVADKYGIEEGDLLSREDSLRLREARRALYSSLRGLGWTWWRIGGFVKRHPKVVARVVGRREERKGELKLMEVEGP